MFRREPRGASASQPPNPGEADPRALANAALELGTARYTDLQLPASAPNFVYRTLIPAWTEANQFVNIPTVQIAQFAAALRDQGDPAQRAAFVELALRKSVALSRRARLIKIIIDAINGLPTGSAEASLLNSLLAKRLGHGKPVRVYPTAELVEHLYANSFGWSILEPFMDDRNVTDIMVNSFNHVFIERLTPSGSSGLIDTGLSFESPTVYSEFVVHLTEDMGRPIGKENPLSDFVLSDGARGNATMFVSRDPSISIRRPQKTRKWTLDMYVEIGSMSQAMADFLRECTLAGANLITYGEVGSGKTTLLGALIDAKPKVKRVITAENPLEILIDEERHPDTVRLIVEEGVEMRDLVRNALRMRPDVLVVGETRDASAYDLLQALSVGSQGSMSTIHANGPASALDRLTSLILLASVGLSERSVRQMVLDAINIIVYVRRLPNGRRVIWRIDEVVGYDVEKSRYDTRCVFRITLGKKNETGDYDLEFLKNPRYRMGHDLRVLFSNEGLDTSRWSPYDAEDEEDLDFGAKMTKVTTDLTARRSGGTVPEDDAAASATARFDDEDDELDLSAALPKLRKPKRTAPAVAE